MVLEDLGRHDQELSILFTDDEHIRQLNRQYLKRDKPTNVLAFPVSSGPARDFEKSILGDVVISVDTAAREAEQAGVSIANRIYRLLLHGLLHLLHYDHEESGQAADCMEREEQRLFELIGGE